MEDPTLARIEETLRAHVVDTKAGQVELKAELEEGRAECAALRKALFGNGSVGFAEEVRMLRRGYRAGLWLAGVIATATVAQAIAQFRP